jgi:hypothetical protein
MKHPCRRAAKITECLGLLALVVLAACCTEKAEVPADFAQAIRVARYLTSPRHLRRSGYMAAIRSRKPSAVVAYLFSDMGIAEWPPRQDASAGEREEARAIGVPLLPNDVILVAGAPDRKLRKQLVLRWNDGGNAFVAEGYSEGDGLPLFHETWTMVKIE